MAVHPTFPGGTPDKPWDKADSRVNEEGGGAAGEVVGGVVEGVAEAAASGCLEGCGGCSLAVLVAFFLAAGTAMAAGAFR